MEPTVHPNDCTWRAETNPATTEGCCNDFGPDGHQVRHWRNVWALRPVEPSLEFLSQLFGLLCWLEEANSASPWPSASCFSDLQFWASAHMRQGSTQQQELTAAEPRVPKTWHIHRSIVVTSLSSHTERGWLPPPREAVAPSRRGKTSAYRVPWCHDQVSFFKISLRRFFLTQWLFEV